MRASSAGPQLAARGALPGRFCALPERLCAQGRYRDAAIGLGRRSHLRRAAPGTGIGARRACREGSIYGLRASGAGFTMLLFWVSWRKAHSFMHFFTFGRSS